MAKRLTNQSQIKKELERARGLARKKRYDEAQAILATVDHPTATKWLEQLNAIAASTPPAGSSASKPKRSFMRRLVIWGGIGFVGLVVLSLVLDALGLLLTTEELNATETAEAMTAVAMARAESIANTETKAVYIITATALASITPTLTPTPTDTLIPTMTPTPLVGRIPLYSTESDVSVYQCPDTTCDVVVSLDQWQAVYGVRRVAGQFLAESTQWWEIAWDGRPAYVHNTYLITTTRPSTTPVYRPQQQQSQQQQSQQQQRQWTCSGDLYNCDDFSTYDEVMSYFKTCPGDPSQLDGNNDGIPCESRR